MSHGHSPADVLRAALCQGGPGTLPSNGGLWPCYVGHMPDDPDNILCVYDTSGQQDGRVMRTGETVIHPGWQIRVRGEDARVAWTKVRVVQRFLDTIRQLGIMLDGAGYRIEAVTQTGSPLPWEGGVEAQKKSAARRDNITINGTMTIKELLP